MNAALHLPPRELPARLGRERCARAGLWFSRAPEWTRRRIALVGARDAHPGTLAYAHQLALSLTRAGYDVVSGGARGVDAAAHRGALEGQGAEGAGRPWLVSPGPLHQPSPPQHAALFDEVAHCGFLLTACAPESNLHRGSFRTRNGLLCALSDLVVVLQASARSGSLHTVRQALARQVPCLALVGPLWDRGYDGCREAIELGAAAITHESQLWRQVNALPPPCGTHGASVTEPQLTLPSAPSPGSLAEARRVPPAAVLSALRTVPTHVDALSVRLGVSTAELSALLLTLSLDDVVKESPTGFWALPSEATPERL